MSMDLETLDTVQIPKFHVSSAKLVHLPRGAGVSNLVIEYKRDSELAGFYYRRNTKDDGFQMSF